MFRRIPYIPQLEVADCGAACLAMVLAYHGKNVSLAATREASGTSQEGVRAGGLADAARRYGLETRAVRADVEDLHLLPAGSILHWEFNHFVVFERLRRHSVDVVDPATGRRRISLKQFGRSYTGVALIFEPGPDFKRQSRDNRGTWRYLRPVLDQGRVLRRVLVTSILLRLFALAVPVFTALLVDRVVPTGNRHLLLVVAAAALVMALYYFLSSFLRAHLLLQLRTHLDLQLTQGFVRHLVDLPYSFFLKRSAGDLLMRMGSNATVREVLTTGAVSAVLDGGSVVLYLFLLLALDWRLGLLVAILGALEGFILLLSLKRNQQLMAESLEATAKTQSFAYQLLAGIEILKAAGAEYRAVERWSSLFVKEINVSLEQGRLHAVIDSLTAGLKLVGPLAVLAYGAAGVLSGELTLGTLLAFNALAGGFLEPLGSLVSTGLQLQLVGRYMQRVNDVLDTPTEQHGQPVRAAGQLEGHVSLEDVSFRYQPSSPPAVENVSVDILPGQKVAIVGASGSGKSTLARLLLGLYQPDGGRVLYDGHDLRDFEARSVRRQIGIVTQNAALFGSSIRSNIALTEPDVPLEAIERAALLACLHDEVERLPMGYETMLADGGASLSGGQRQRIALARAVLARPRLLLLDEATNALDAVTEQLVYQNLKGLNATLIVIAHRLSTVADADLILVMDRGRVVERGTHCQLLCQDGPYGRLVAGRIPGSEPPSAVLTAHPSDGLGWLSRAKQLTRWPPQQTQA